MGCLGSWGPLPQASTPRSQSRSHTYSPLFPRDVQQRSLGGGSWERPSVSGDSNWEGGGGQTGEGGGGAEQILPLPLDKFSPPPLPTSGQPRGATWGRSGRKGSPEEVQGCCGRVREDISPDGKPRGRVWIKMHSPGDPKLNVDRTRLGEGHGESGRPGWRRAHG